jgi:hypothetical protein
MTVNIDLLDAELKVAQTECDDIDTAIAQIAADDVDAKARLIELSERRKIAGERLSRISTALTEARSGSAWLQHAANGSRECAPDDRLCEAIHSAPKPNDGLFRPSGGAYDRLMSLALCFSFLEKSTGSPRRALMRAAS